MRLNLLDDALHPFHDLSKIIFNMAGLQAELLGALGIGNHFGGADQGFTRHTAGIQAVSAHLVLFNQSDLGLNRCSDIGGDQAAGAGADRDQVVVKFLGFFPAVKGLAAFDDVDDAFGDQREDTEQHEGDQNAWRKDSRGTLDLTKLGAGVDVDRCAGKHADLADQVVGSSTHRRQAHNQVDNEEGKEWHQTQGEEVEGALALDTFIDRLELVSELSLYPVSQQKTRRQKSQCCTDGARKGDGDQGGPETEQTAACQGHHRSARKGESCDHDVENEVNGDGQETVGSIEFGKGLLSVFEVFKGQEAL